MFVNQEEKNLSLRLAFLRDICDSALNRSLHGKPSVLGVPIVDDEGNTVVVDIALDFRLAINLRYFDDLARPVISQTLEVARQAGLVKCVRLFETRAIGYAMTHGFSDRSAAEIEAALKPALRVVGP